MIQSSVSVSLVMSLVATSLLGAGCSPPLSSTPPTPVEQRAFLQLTDEDPTDPPPDEPPTDDPDYPPDDPEADPQTPSDPWTDPWTDPPVDEPPTEDPGYPPSEPTDPSGDPTEPPIEDPTTDPMGEPGADPNTPEAGTPEETTPPETAIRAPLWNGKGIIIPAYLTLGIADAGGWASLAQGAATLRDAVAANKTIYSDYWVAVNSGNHGPYRTRAEWDDATLVWDRIRDNGGKIFGYVHTTKTPTSVEFVPLETVEADVQTWLEGYPPLDGIWIDEFYPRFEIGDKNIPPTLIEPNGTNAAPADKRYRNADGTFNGGASIAPDGGYYAKLTNFIRMKNSNLKIIGNAGGRLWSNQQQYAGLVDVLCSFEQTYQYAYATQYYGVGLLRQDTSSSRPELALIHTNSFDMAGAMRDAFAAGYTHVYTTDRWLKNADGSDYNLWGGLASYFSTQIDTLATMK